MSSKSIIVTINSPNIIEKEWCLPATDFVASDEHAHFQTNHQCSDCGAIDDQPSKGAPEDWLGLTWCQWVHCLLEQRTMD